jgi:O-antigen/teichoic acid export membrane protein
MSLRARTIEAVGWTSGAKTAQHVLQFGLSIILMRTLGPDPFGLIAMILVFSGFVAIFGELGFSSALVQRQDLREEHRSTTFWLNLAMAAVLASITYLAAPFIAAFYREPLLAPMTTWMSLAFLLSAPGFVPRALLQKALRFDVLAKADVAALGVSGAAAIAVAGAGGGAWSLVTQQLVAAAATSALLLWLVGWHPRARWSQQALRELFGYGAGLTGFKLINYWARSADKLLIGRLLGSEALGLYSRAYSLMLLPLTHVVSVLTPVMLPALSSIQGDRARVRGAFLRVINLLTFVTFPMALGLAVVAEPFVLGLLGADWRAVIPLTQILAFVGVTQAVCNPTGWIYTSQGRTDWMFWWAVGAGGFLVLSISIGVMLGGVETVAVAYLAGNLIITIPCLALPGRLVGMTVADVWRVVRGNLLCATGMALLVWGLGQVLSTRMTPLPQLLVQVTTGALGYGALAYVTGQTALKELTQIRLHVTSRQARATAGATPDSGQVMEH